MPLKEQKKRIGIMQNRLKIDVVKWATSFIDELEGIKVSKRFQTRMLNANAKRIIRHSFERAKRRILLLDYDGTLVPL